MIKFKLISQGINANQRKAWLSPKCKTLKIPFILSDIKPGMFNKSVMKRLRQAKEHGTRIILRKGKMGGGYFIGIQVINKVSQLEQNKNITQLKRRYSILLKDTLILEFMDIREKLRNNGIWNLS